MMRMFRERRRQGGVWIVVVPSRSGPRCKTKRPGSTRHPTNRPTGTNQWTRSRSKTVIQQSLAANLALKMATTNQGKARKANTSIDPDSMWSWFCLFVCLFVVYGVTRTQEPPPFLDRHEAMIMFGGRRKRRQGKGCVWIVVPSRSGPRDKQKDQGRHGSPQTGGQDPKNIPNRHRM